MRLRDSDASGDIWQKGNVSLRKSIYTRTEEAGREWVWREEGPKHDEVSQ